MNVEFYSNAPFHQLLVYIFSLISSSPIDISYIIYPIVSGIVVILVVSQISRLISTDYPNNSAVLGGVLITIAVLGVKYGYQPIPQTLAVVYLSLFFLMLIKYTRSTDPGFFTILFILFVSLSFTHKLPLLLIFGMSLGIPIVYFLSNKALRYDRLQIKYLKRISPIILISALILFSQWEFITNYFDTIVVKISILLREYSTIGASSPSKKGFQAIQPLPQPIRLVYNRGHGIVLLPLSAVAGLGILSSRRLWAKSIIIGSAAAVVPFMFIGVVAPNTVAPLRLILYVEFILVTLISIWAVKMANTSHISRLLAIFIIIFLISSQIFSPHISPDAPGEPRFYLNNQELSAESFSSEYINDKIITDTYYVLHMQNRECVSCEEKYIYDEEALLTGAILENQYEYVMYRTEVDVYWFSRYSNYQLTWNPEKKYDQNYDRVYSNGQVNSYSRPR
jgi:hypothetical protein